jgi:polyribonucleotide nucleotidyltransferase
MVKSNEIIKEVEFNGEKLIYKTGKLAPRADSAVWLQVGETVVLATVAVGKEDSNLDYFPLSIEYIEKFYAGGIISGSRFMKREMRPSDSAVLKARQIDHSIRSLFPKSFKKEVAVIVTVLAYDKEHDPEMLAVNAASSALMISSTPFLGPSTSVRVGISKEGELLLNPSESTVESLSAEYMVSVREDRVLNIEGWGDQVSEEMMGKLLDFAVEKCQPLLQAQKELAAMVNKKKMESPELPVNEEILAFVKADYSDQISEALYDKEERESILKTVKNDVLAKKPDYKMSDIDAVVEYIARKIMRKNVLESEKRTSGRKLDEVRELEIEVGVLPRVHGSSLFRRGKTQSLTVLTLGSTRMAQNLESYEGEEIKTFMHHYNGPGYSMGQAGRFSYYPGRREIGHGHIAENALKMVLPSTETFPYTIRVVSEILAQQGSSSMAATCATTLALMDGGVPIKDKVAGISVGLVTDDSDLKNYKLLVDMEDVEDFYGDMDFKVTGTENGVTAIQLDNKLMGVPVSILKDAMAASRKARVFILGEMNSVINAPRESLGKYAPRVVAIHIDPSRIGELIGPGGKMIKSIIEKTENMVDIDIQDDGTVNVTSASAEKMDEAIAMINSIIFVPELGQVYKGVVEKIAEYGAFVALTPSVTGLLHVSEMADKFVKDPRDIVKEGQEIEVKVVKLDNGKVSLSLKNLPKQAE